MSLENQVAVLSQNVGNLVNRVTTQANAWDAQVAQAVQTVNNHVANARAEMPFIRVSPNQRLLYPNSSSAPYGWILGGYYSLEYIEIRNGIPASDRTPFETEFLSSCFGSVMQNLSTPFYVMRVTVNSNVAPFVFGNRHANAGPNRYTFAFYAKILSGSLLEGEVFKTFSNGWSLVGKRIVTNGLNFDHYDWNMVTSNDLIIYVALPACVVGYFPFDAYQWGFFPQVAIPSFANTTDLEILRN